jgi:hypothetical protein
MYEAQRNLRFSLTVSFCFWALHSVRSDFSCHDLITSNFTIFHPISNKSFRVSFWSSSAIERNRISFRSIDQDSPRFPRLLILCMKIKIARFRQCIWFPQAVTNLYEQGTFGSAISLTMNFNKVCLYRGVKVGRCHRWVHPTSSLTNISDPPRRRNFIRIGNFTCFVEWTFGT